MPLIIIELRIRLLIAISILMAACNDGSSDRSRMVIPDRAEIEDVNRYLVQKDRERIENYIERKGLNMEISPTGLWYGIQHAGVGDSVRANDKLVISYACSLLDGTNVYSSNETGLKSIVVGKSSIESGLDEGLRMLRGGGKAVFILPSYLAHGLIGDGESIPARAILVYEISILKHNENEFNE